MIIEYDNKKFDINLDKAKELGLLTEIKKKRPVYVKDIPNGSIFRWHSDECDYEYVMINNTLQKNGQCVKISNGFERGRITWISSDVSLKYYNKSTDTWIKEIEE